MRVLDLVVSHNSPIVMKDVIPKCADIIVRFFPPGLSDDTVSGSRIYACL